VDFPEADLTEQEEIDQALRDIDNGCCVGEFTETGEVTLDRQTLFGHDGVSCSDIETELLDRLIRDGQVTFEEQPHPTLKGSRRRIYKAHRDKQRGNQ
jgi:hypothetical protein